jgi:flagellar motility protein MotE (MotC chaperone)
MILDSKQLLSGRDFNNDDWQLRVANEIYKHTYGADVTDYEVCQRIACILAQNAEIAEMQAAHSEIVNDNHVIRKHNREQQNYIDAIQDTLKAAHQYVDGKRQDRANILQLLTAVTKTKK